MSCSLVLGVNGQDGSYLAETLLSRGRQVVGVGRAAESKYVKPSPNFRYVSCDLRNLASFAELVTAIAPNEAYHFAAVHGAYGFSYEAAWRDMMAVNVLSLHVLLEHARTRAPQMRIAYANSSKILPSPLSGTIDEDHEQRATCLYGIGKIAARDLLMNYRSHHGVCATNLLLFNHESPRRPPEYMLPTIARAIASAKTDPHHRTSVRTLDFRIDWGAADEFMEIVADISEKADAPEFVLASGTTWHARDAVEHLFALHGLAASDHVHETLERGDPGPSFTVSLDRLQAAVGRRPRKTIDNIVHAMIGELARA